MHQFTESLSGFIVGMLYVSIVGRAYGMLEEPAQLVTSRGKVSTGPEEKGKEGM
jgi:hypothetical protein